MGGCGACVPCVPSHLRTPAFDLNLSFAGFPCPHSGVFWVVGEYEAGLVSPPLASVLGQLRLRWPSWAHAPSLEHLPGALVCVRCVCASHSQDSGCDPLLVLVLFLICIFTPRTRALRTPALSCPSSSCVWVLSSCSVSLGHRRGCPPLPPWGQKWTGLPGGSCPVGSLLFLDSDSVTLGQ